MPHYVLLMNWTEQGVKTFKDSVDRSEKARAAFQAQGVTYWPGGKRPSSAGSTSRR